MSDYIKESSRRVLSERREYNMFGRIEVFIKDPLPSEVDMTDVIKDLEDIVPSKLMYNIDMLMVGQFQELNSRGIRAAFMDGAIYVTNQQPNSEQILEDIIHEIAHSVELEYGDVIYSDGLLEREYLQKKKMFLDKLSSHGVKIPNRLRVGVEYSKMFDEFLHYEIGFEKSNNISMGIFLEPYSSVSISEYFATVFEYYFMSEDLEYLKRLSPVAYDKISKLNQEE